MEGPEGPAEDKKRMSGRRRDGRSERMSGRRRDGRSEVTAEGTD